MSKLLLVEDERDFRNLLSSFLQMQGFEIVTAEDGEEGWSQYKSSRPDLCILDIMLPKKDGFSLAAEIKKDNPEMWIVFLTARNLKEDRLKGLLLADDYICKPFEIEELVQRIYNLLNRRNKIEPNSNNEFVIGKYTFNFGGLKLMGPDTVHNLTLREAELLKYLIEHINQTVRREDILADLWGDNDYFLGRSMDVFISRLRKYFKEDPSILLETIRKVGYILKVVD
jgi:DNA-binding response OmpR family regulator